jgi:ubiquinone/menaquinone biosynthesis C-methylase UbiE
MEYNVFANSYNELYGKEQVKKIKIIKPFIKTNSKSLILDVGCGTGIASKDLLGIKYGIDNSKELLKKADLKQFLGEAENLPFQNNMFDLVISLTAIHNFTDPEKAILEMNRVAKNQIVITVLKKSKFLDKISKQIKKHLKINKKIEEEKDIIFICSKNS